MGFTPQQVGRMSLYQFACCVDGYNKANATETVEHPTAEEFAAAKAFFGDAE